MINQKETKVNKILTILFIVISALFLIYFIGYQLGKANYYFTHIKI